MILTKLRADAVAGDSVLPGHGMVLVVSLVALVGFIVDRYISRVPYLNLSHSSAMFLLGAVSISLLSGAAQDVAVASIITIPFSVYCHVFLPMLIFDASCSVSNAALRRVLPHGFMLATVGLILNTVLLAAGIMALPGVFTASWTWYHALFFSGIVSATDPVSVVSLLKSLKVDPDLTAVINTESILNDGTAIIAYLLLEGAAAQGYWVKSGVDSLTAILQATVVSAAVGHAGGVVVRGYFRLVRRMDPSATALHCIGMLVVSYLTYFVADIVCGSSGVCATFVMGAYLAHHEPIHFPGTEKQPIRVLRDTVCLTLNSLLFFLAGCIVFGDVTGFGMTLPSVALGLVFFVLATVVRAIVVPATLLPTSWLFPSYRPPWSHHVFLVHGALRGGVASILMIGALSMRKIPAGVRQQMFVCACGLIAATMLGNGLTAPWLCRRLRLARRPFYHRLLLHRGYAVAESVVSAAVERMLLLQMRRGNTAPQALSEAPPLDGIQVDDEEPTSPHVAGRVRIAFAAPHTMPPYHTGAACVALQQQFINVYGAVSPFGIDPLSSALAAVKQLVPPAHCESVAGRLRRDRWREGRPASANFHDPPSSDTADLSTTSMEKGATTAAKLPVAPLARDIYRAMMAAFQGRVRYELASRFENGSFADAASTVAGPLLRMTDDSEFAGDLLQLDDVVAQLLEGSDASRACDRDSVMQLIRGGTHAAVSPAGHSSPWVSIRAGTALWRLWWEALRLGRPLPLRKRWSSDVLENLVALPRLEEGASFASPTHVPRDDPDATGAHEELVVALLLFVDVATPAVISAVELGLDFCSAEADRLLNADPTHAATSFFSGDLRRAIQDDIDAWQARCTATCAELTSHLDEAAALHGVPGRAWLRLYSLAEMSTALDRAALLEAAGVLVRDGGVVADEAASLCLPAAR